MNASEEHFNVEFDNENIDYDCSNGINFKEHNANAYGHFSHDDIFRTGVYLPFIIDDYQIDSAICNFDIDLVYEGKHFRFDLEVIFDGSEPQYIVTEKQFEEGWNLITLSEAIEYDYLSENDIKAAYYYDAHDQKYYDVFDNEENEVFENAIRNTGIAVIWAYFSEEQEVRATISKEDLQMMAENYGEHYNKEFAQGWNYFAIMPHMSKQYDNGFLDIGYDNGAISRYNSLFFWDLEEQEWDSEDWSEVVEDDDILHSAEVILYPYLTYYNFDYTAEFQGWSDIPDFPDMIPPMPVQPAPSPSNGGSSGSSGVIVEVEPVVQE